MSGRRSQSRMSASARAIFQVLKSDIALGRLNPRERLIEAELVDRFQSNRPAVREALGELTKMHLVEHIPNKGVRVTEVSLPELKQIYQMRIELEELAAKWLPLPLPDDQLSKLEEVQVQHSQAVADLDYREIFRLDELFHDTLNANCGNPYLDEMIDIMSARGVLARYSAFMDQSFLEEVRDEHLAIIDAIRSEERPRLISVMRAHNQRGLTWFSAHIARKNGLQPHPPSEKAG